MTETGLSSEIDNALAELTADSPADLEATGRKIRSKIMETPLPETIRFALFYRLHHGLYDRETPMAVLVIEMIQPRFSGVLYTADPIGDALDNIRISAVRGLGETLVGGETSPQQTYRINKRAFAVSDMTGMAGGCARSLSPHHGTLEEECGGYGIGRSAGRLAIWLLDLG